MKMDNRHVISVLVENQAGVLSRVSGLFSRRGYNIDSLSVGETADPKFSRITLVARGDEHILEQIEKQLNKLIDVIKVETLDPDSSVFRELALIKINAQTGARASITEIVDIFQAKIVDVSSSSLTVEITGDESKINAFIDLMRPYGIKELVRSGLTALARGPHALNENEEEV